MAGTTSTTLVRLAAFAKATLAVAKFAAASASGSAAMLAEAVHSMAGAISLGLLAFGLAASGSATLLSARRETVFWGYVVGTMVMSLAAGVAIVLGVQRWQVPETLAVESLPFFVLAAAAAIEFGFFQAARAERHRCLAAAPGPIVEDPALRTILLQGYCAPAGLVAAAGGLIASAGWDQHDVDGIAAILVGLVIGSTAALLAFEVRSVLLHAVLAPTATIASSPRSTSKAPASTVKASTSATPSSRNPIIETSAGSVLAAPITSLTTTTGAAAPPSVTLVETLASSAAPLTETGKGAAEVAPFRHSATEPTTSSYPPPKRGKAQKKR